MRNPADAVQQWPIDRLRPFERNARTHSEEQIQQIAASIREWGWTNPVLATPDGTIIAGHGRVRAAQALGMAEVPVTVADGWTEAQVRAYVLADNKLAANAGWDEALLAVELDELRDLKFDMTLMGFAPGELNDLIGTPNTGCDPDEVPPVPVEPVSRAGDLWLLGRHRLLCGDSTEAEDVARLMGGAKAAFVLTDPPYGMDLDTDWSGAIGAIGHGTKGNKYPKVIGDDAPFDPSHLFEAWGAAREFFLFGADYYAERIPSRSKGSWLAWDKRKPSQADAIGAEFELIWSKAKHKRRMMRHDWFGFLSSANSAEAHNRLHPTQKPTSLLVDILTQWGKPGDSIVDPYLGSGTTIIAAEMTGRACYALEIAPPYVDVSVLRWQQFTGKQATLDGDGRTFEEVKRERAQATTDAPEAAQSLA